MYTPQKYRTNRAQKIPFCSFLFHFSIIAFIIPQGIPQSSRVESLAGASYSNCYIQRRNLKKCYN